MIITVNTIDIDIFLATKKDQNKETNHQWPTELEMGLLPDT